MGADGATVKFDIPGDNLDEAIKLAKDAQFKPLRVVVFESSL